MQIIDELKCQCDWPEHDGSNCADCDKPLSKRTIRTKKEIELLRQQIEDELKIPVKVLVEFINNSIDSFRYSICNSNRSFTTPYFYLTEPMFNLNWARYLKFCMESSQHGKIWKTKMIEKGYLVFNKDENNYILSEKGYLGCTSDENLGIYQKDYVINANVK